MPNFKSAFSCSVLMGALVTLMTPVVANAGLDGIPDNCVYSYGFNKAEGGYNCRGWYAGLGTGLSFLKPEFDGTQGEGVEEVNHFLVPNIYAGYDFNHNWGAEVHYSNLNAAKFEKGLAAGLEIKYDYIGASGLFHFKSHLPTSGGPLPGLNGYAKFGLGKLLTSVKTPADNNLEVELRHVAPVQVHFGFGAEYMFHSGWGIRTEYMTHDIDAAELTLSVINRAARVVKPFVLAFPTAAVKAKAKALEICNNPTGVMDGIEFVVNSAQLTASAETVLDNIVLQLFDYPNIKLEVRAHTDSDGADDFNQQLSEERASTVQNYFYVRGFVNIKSKGYGESQPIAQNDSAKNKAKNRRVEIEILSNECK